MELADLVPKSEIRTWVGPFWDPDRYLETGRSECARLIRPSGLQPSDRIIDLGCGCGRITIHLAQFLSEGSSYLGFDHSAPLVNWCLREIQPRYPNFQFQLADIHNGGSNPEGVLSAGQIKLDSSGNDTDVVLAISLFTHMRMGDIQAYLREVYRVLKPGGRLLATYFLLNEKSIAAIDAKAATYAFVFPVDVDSRSWTKEVPEEAIAHPEARIVEAYRNVGLNIATILYGGWTRNASEDHQDLVIAEKKGGA